MKISKYLSVLVLVLVALLLSGFTFAYWVGNVDTATAKLSDYEQTVTVGMAKDVTTEIDISKTLQGSNLVPEGQAKNSKLKGTIEPTESVKVPVNVLWKSEDKNVYDKREIQGLLTTTDPKLVVTGNDGKIVEKVEGMSDLFKVEIVEGNESQDIFLNDGATSAVTVNFIVKFNRQPTQAEYTKVINGTIKLEATFNAEYANYINRIDK